MGEINMTLGNKISKKRKENNYTQEQLAEILGVSRQAISKWESDITYPETEKLIRLSELFHCSLDYLLKDAEETVDGNDSNEKTPFFQKILQERKSEKNVWGMPLWHMGRKARGFVAVGINARGVIAVGVKAKGIISFGVLSIGILSIGMFSLGLLALGWLALGICSAGCFAVGVVAFGAISLGILSFGAIAIGDFSAGALAIGKYFAKGDHAKAMIALGKTQVEGTAFQKIGELSVQDQRTIERLLETEVPASLSWANKILRWLYFVE